MTGPSPSPPLTLVIRTDPDGVQHLSTLYDGCEIPVPTTPQLQRLMRSVQAAIAEKQSAPEDR